MRLDETEEVRKSYEDMGIPIIYTRIKGWIAGGKSRPYSDIRYTVSSYFLYEQILLCGTKSKTDIAFQLI